ncbi:DUF692 domain-containing protein [Bowmanella sp. JS7-9]|uniref:DUF692 domain-containing protein n=1 Tax=Pseudobowmanella zhangzhouensis TaxID=1537679 RepID=A0ABW1XJ41_9ALTE|nr:DUF692 domain-containing protein [Bowmanella sp. JS7-9]TBX25681.1 hypothetical protein TK45_03010 [Bowmanella sp. JS7-9]
MKSNGVGLGLRRSMLAEIESWPGQVPVDFWEIAPENWMELGGRYAKVFKKLTDAYRFTSHGLSLSIGSVDPLDVDFVKDLNVFLTQHNIDIYSEHLSYCSMNGHLYDLMPIPFTTEAVKHVSDRIQQVQEITQRPLILENVSYYAAPGQEMTELDFICEVIGQSGCQLMLDVNNVYVNAINHGYDAKAFIQGLPSQSIVYGHIAGHFDEADDLLVDTHGADVKPQVWDLLRFAYQTHGVFPTTLERDFNIPPLVDLLKEVEAIRSIQAEFKSVLDVVNG